ncbi:MAG: ABC transporter permease [Sterolibacterium sp.]|nr:ABC transporter permease [Sterolibacterium sp.]
MRPGEARALRNSTAITLSVWKALFLREALSRLFARRATWFWLLAEPVFHASYLLVIYTVVRVHTVGGIDTTIWLMIGLLAFFMFRRTATQLMNAVDANKALFTYRQVTPVDTVLVRAGLEGFLMTIIAGILLAGAALFGHQVIPADPLAVLEAFFGLWLSGIGFGLIASVIGELIPELDQIIQLILRPLYILSGVIVPLSAVKQPYRGWLMLNPVAQGVEAARLGFSPYYHAVPELSIGYVYGFALVSIFLGLALHRRFRLRLITQ